MYTSPRLPAKPIALISMLFLLLSSGCLANQAVRVSRMPDVDFSGYRTWSFIPHQVDPDERPSAREIELGARVLERIRDDLARRGLRYQAKDADLGIDARLVIKPQRVISYEHTAMQTLHSFHHGVNYEIEATQRKTTIQHRVRLMIRAVNLHPQREIWRADYERTVADWAAPALRGVVEATLASFPRDFVGFDDSDDSNEVDREVLRLVRVNSESRGDPE